MSDKEGCLRVLIVPIIAVLVTGGTVPWWYEKVASSISKFNFNPTFNNNTRKCLGFVSSDLRKNYIVNNNSYASFYIVNTYENSYYAGLRQGDLIMTANNMPISNVSDLPSLSASLPVGSIVTIVIARPSSYILFPDYSYKFSYPVSLYALQIPITNNCSS